MNISDSEIEKFANLMVADHDIENLPKEVAVKRSAIMAAKWARDHKPWMIEITDILYGEGWTDKEKVIELQKIIEYHFG
jgi:hypothetical protein